MGTVSGDSLPFFDPLPWQPFYLPAVTHVETLFLNFLDQSGLLLTGHYLGNTLVSEGSQGFALGFLP